MLAKKFKSFWVVFSLFCLIIANCGTSKDSFIDLLLINGKIWTVSPSMPWAEAVAIHGNQIVLVGKTAELKKYTGSSTQIIDLQGKFVIPGFNDAHVHFRNGGASLLGIKLREAKNENEFTERIREKAQTLSPGAWITGGEWDHEAWPSQKLPTKELIDAVTPETPVLVDRLDGHVALANNLALRMAGVNKNTRDPQGGKIDRNPLTGEPTGILWDEAIGLVGRIIPATRKTEIQQQLGAALQHAMELGVTSIQDNSFATDLTIYQELMAAGKLTVRVNAWRAWELAKNYENIGIQAMFGNSMIQLGTMKVFSDGSMGAGSALFFAPYADEPSTSGIPIYPEAELYQLIEKVDEMGLQVATHAIGDKANHWVLNAYEKAMLKSGRKNARHRIEHAQVVTDSDLPRFAQQGVIASIQPSHCIDDMRWAEKRIGKERCTDAYRFKSLVDAGAKLAFGTDWPVEPLNPMLGLYAAVTREYPEGGPTGGWQPSEKLSMEQAIEFYTLGSAYAEFSENKKGTIEPGKLADITVLSNNLFEIPPQKILETQVLMTIFDGKVVYKRDEKM
ncbi:amidohydrolase [candidate division KSB1 bacterium]|nr:amidohydrolase [candidate division KSB1 bacterium]